MLLDFDENFAASTVTFSPERSGAVKDSSSKTRSMTV